MFGFIRNFFNELVRRGVLHVTALYVVGAWVALQVADLAFPGLDVPESAIRYVWIGALIGFPIALLIGWRYDVTTAGIVRTAGTDSDVASLTRKDYAILSTLGLSITAVTAALLWQIWQAGEAVPAHAVAKDVNPVSIAVLPFENMSGDPANQPFTTGIHDDLLTHVAKIRDIKVISRTSVARLDTTIGVRAIGQLLGVATVLEGGVQRAGDRIRINAQLIDAKTDEHLWAETFDRELTTQNIFAIQSEIAETIAGELQVTLSTQDRVDLDRLPTESLDAYEAYMLGRQRMLFRTRAGLEQARAYFQQAVDLDPGYALAWVGLAETQALQANYGYVPTDEATEQSLASVEKALALDEDLAPAHASLGLARVISGDEAGGEAAYKRAIALDSNYAPGFHWYSTLLSDRIGDYDRALPLIKRARELDPLSPTINVTVGEVLLNQGRFDDALAQFKKTIEIAPEYPNGYLFIGTMYRSVFARPDQGVRWHREALVHDPTLAFGSLGFSYLDLGDPDQAEYWFERERAINPDAFWPRAGLVMVGIRRGEETKAVAAARTLLETFERNNISLYTLVKYGHYTEVIDKFSPHYPELACNEVPLVDPLNWFIALNLSLAWEQTGEQDCADKLLAVTLAYIKTRPRLGFPHGYGAADVEIYARQGNSRLALDTLRAAIDEGYRWAWWSQVEQSPHTVSLYEEPEFKAMMAELNADMATQLKRVNEWEARGELAAVPEPAD